MNGSHEANGTAVVDGATKLEVRWELRMSRYAFSRSLTLPTNHKLTFKTISINSFLSRRFRCRRFSINQTVQNHHRKAPQMATLAKISRKCRIKPFPGHSQRVAWWLTRRKRKERSVVWFNRRPRAAVNFWSRFHLCTIRVQLESRKIFVFKSSQVLNPFLLIKMKNIFKMKLSAASWRRHHFLSSDNHEKKKLRVEAFGVDAKVVHRISFFDTESRSRLHHNFLLSSGSKL